MHEKINLTPCVPGVEIEHDLTCKNETELPKLAQPTYFF